MYSAEQPQQETCGSRPVPRVDMAHLTRRHDAVVLESKPRQHMLLVYRL